MSPAPQLSVLIPFFNEAGNIHPVIEEVRATLAGIDFEIVCVNDAPGDATGAELAEMKAKYPDLITVLTHLPS